MEINNELMSMMTMTLCITDSDHQLTKDQSWINDQFLRTTDINPDYDYDYMHD